MDKALRDLERRFLQGDTSLAVELFTALSTRPEDYLESFQKEINILNQKGIQFQIEDV